ncbi:hypothetical protein [Oharaeibacter diazotrophicus]|uniref:hypothetical protein n=1 Tax=Oharaeibacter diazotrophicus TaxID=1920512 RepID=UPI000F81A920|nr:hypothetical protein [Oharaeibacter diazotrophicus]
MSRYSPGVVMDEEMIIRLVVSPADIHPTEDRIISSALSSAESFGLSTLRSRYATEVDIIETAEEVLARATKNSGSRRYLVGAFEAPVALFRRMDANKKLTRVYGVYDTAMVNRRSHADVFMALSNFAGGARDKARKNMLRLLMDYFHPVRDFRGGLIARFGQDA